jgi:hypothetical protein
MVLPIQQQDTGPEAAARIEEQAVHIVGRAARIAVPILVGTPLEEQW